MQASAKNLTFQSTSEAQTITYGRHLGQLLDVGQLIALIGDLGTGKTRWAQGIGAGLAVSDDTIINSPTFTFVNQYEGRYRCYHIDLYRLDSVREAETLGLDDYFYSDGICIVEWADRVRPILPSERLEIHLHHVDESVRDVIMNAYGDAAQKLLSQFQTQALA